jgi:hypothetical protein
VRTPTTFEDSMSIRGDPEDPEVVTPLLHVTCK